MTGRPAFWVLFVLAAMSMPAWAAARPDRDEFDRRLALEIEARSPEAARLWAEANAARDRGDHASAAARYADVLAIAPDFVHAKRRLSGEELRQGHRDRAIALGREALGADPSTENRVGLAANLATRVDGSEPTEPELAEAAGLADRAAIDAPDDHYAQAVGCQVAIARKDLARLKRCVDRLRAIEPEDVATDQFTAILALAERRFADAESALERARAHGLPDAQYASFHKAILDSRPLTARFGPAVLDILGAWTGALALLFAVGSLLSRVVLREAENLSRLGAHQPSRGSATLRKAYALVLWLSSAYYFVSVPILVLLVLATGGGILYALFAIGRVPVKLAAVVAVLTLTTLWAILKSLVVRGKDEEPGERLDMRAQPRLASLLGDVARRLETRPVDNVYLTPGTELAVMERGGIGRQLRGGSERCLILGVGVLDGLRIGPFKAVLAHEFGHFRNRDTAGGGLAIAVRRSLLAMATGLAQGGAAAWYNPAWLFLNVFHRVFLRISQGASRLQEIMADRWAALAYGSKAFEAGLRHVIERSVRFDALAGMALQETRARDLSNLYTHEPAQPVPEAEVERAVREALNRAPSPYDSHPSPAERTRWTRALNAKGAALDPGDDAAAWDLFADRRAIEERMTGHVVALVLASEPAQSA